MTRIFVKFPRKKILDNSSKMESRNLINKKYYESSKEHCSVCKIDVSKAGKAYHFSSKKHIANMEKINGEFDAISILEQTLVKLKANPDNSKDICIELINTLSGSLNYKSQEPKQKNEEVVEKEVVEKPREVADKPKKIIKKKEPSITDCIANISNAITLDYPLSDKAQEYLDKKWIEANKHLEQREIQTIFTKQEIPRETSLMVRYNFMKDWLDNKYLMEGELVCDEDYTDITNIINDDCLFDLRDTNLEEKHQKVIRFCYWRIINGAKFKKFQKKGLSLEEKN